MKDDSISWAELLSGEISELTPVARGLLLHILEFQATHNLPWNEFAGAVGPVLQMFNRLLADNKDQS